MTKLKNFFANLPRMEHISLQRFIFLFTLSVAFIAAFIRKVNPELKFFSHRAIGNTILNGIDAKIYVSSFYVCIIIFFVVFWAGNFIINLLKKLAHSRNLDYEFSLISDFSFITLINMIIFLYDILQSRIIQPVPYIIFAAFGFVILHTLLNIILPERFCVHESDSLKRLWTSLIFILPAVMTFFVLLVKNYGQNNIIVLSSPQFLIIYAIFYLLARLFIRSNKIIAVSISALVPLSFLPVTYIFASELQYTLTKHGVYTTPEKIALIVSIIILFLAAIIIFRRKSYNFDENILSARLEKIILPVLLVTMALFMNYEQKITPLFDYLHTGNGVVPAQQVYQFGSIPCIDYWAPTHWPVGAFIYSLLNGYNFLEISIGNNIFEAIILTLVCYFVLKKFTGGTFAALLLCFTPMLSYMNLYYCSGFLPLLYLDTMRQNKRVRDYAIIAVLALLSFAFMPSSGKIAILTSIIMIIFTCSGKKDFINAAKGFLGAIFISGAIYFILVILRGESIIDRIKLIQAFADCDIEIGAYWSLINSKNSPFEIITCYGLYPLIIIAGLVFALRVREKKSINYSLIYILIAELVAYLRVFARHSLLEDNQVLFFPFAFCMLSIVFIKNKIFKRAALFMIILLTVYTPYYNSKTGTAEFNGNHGLANYAMKNFEFITYKQGDSRFNTRENILYPENLRNVLDSVLDKNQTFFDGINAHLLYALMEREAPFLHHSVQLIFNEPGQEAYINQFVKDYERGRIPIVISYYKPLNNKEIYVFTDIDQIPIELSIYKLHEFINTHYDPWLIVDGFYLMKAKNSNINYEIPAKSENIIPYNELEQNTKMWLLPYIWANYDGKIKKNFPVELQNVAQSFTIEGNISQDFKLDPEIDKSSGNYLYFRITADKDNSSDDYQANYKGGIGMGVYLRAYTQSTGEINISYGEGRAKSSFLIMPGTHDYLVRISCQQKWMRENQNNITINSSIPVKLEKFSVLKGD